jgi:hypothetical protein
MKHTDPLDDMPSMDGMFWKMIKSMWKTLLVIWVIASVGIFSLFYLINHAIAHLPK